MDISPCRRCQAGVAVAGELHHIAAEQLHDLTSSKRTPNGINNGTRELMRVLCICFTASNQRSCACGTLTITLPAWKSGQCNCRVAWHLGCPHAAYPVQNTPEEGVLLLIFQTETTRSIWADKCIARPRKSWIKNTWLSTAAKGQGGLVQLCHKQQGI